MALNLKNSEVERLAREVAQLAGETKTEAIRRALAERKARLQMAGHRSKKNSGRLLKYLERSVWPYVKPEALGRPIPQKEQDEILGYGPEGF